MEQKNKKKISTQTIIKLLLAVVLLGLSTFLLKGDVWTFWTWWLLAGVMGFAAMPVTGRLFWRFEDKGWIFSKVLAIAATGFLTWFLTAIRLIPFNALTCAAVTILCAVICFFLLRKESKEKTECFPVDRISLIYWEELLFFAAFLTVNIGVMNLLHLPALDGGRTVFALIELISGKAVPAEKEGIVHLVGFVLLIGLMIFVTWNDISRLISG